MNPNSEYLPGIKRNQIVKFSNREWAFSSLKNYVKHCHVVMLGDDGKYWVVSITTSRKLEAMGYERA